MGYFHPHDEQALLIRFTTISFTKRLERSLCAAYCVLREFLVQLVVCYVSLNCSLSVLSRGEGK